MIIVINELDEEEVRWMAFVLSVVGRGYVPRAAG
jgi:hypothetical protein